MVSTIETVYTVRALTRLNLLSSTSQLCYKKRERQGVRETETAEITARYVNVKLRIEHRAPMSSTEVTSLIKEAFDRCVVGRPAQNEKDPVWSSTRRARTTPLDGFESYAFSASPIRRIAPRS